jgi:DNA-binding NarL/FixJ family response regulator
MSALVLFVDSSAMDDDTAPTVVLVDDSASIRERLKELLSIGAPVRIVGEAGTAAAAICEIKATQPDFVVLDHQLPDGTGLEVLHAVRAEVPHSCFIVLTNHASMELRKAFETAGAQFFLDKSHEFGRLGKLIAGAHSPGQ